MKIAIETVERGSISQMMERGWIKMSGVWKAGMVMREKEKRK